MCSNAVSQTVILFILKIGSHLDTTIIGLFPAS